MVLSSAKYRLITIFYVLFIFVTLPITPTLWNYFQGIFGYLPIYFIYFMYLLGITTILVYIYFISQERDIIIYLKFIAIATIFGYYLKTIIIPTEKIHLIEYVLLSYFIAKAFCLGDKRNQDIYYFHAFLLITFIGFLDEGIQYYLPNRVFDMKDVFINSLAGFLGLAYLRLIIYPHPKEPLKVIQ
jgi:VanZ family protein